MKVPPKSGTLALSLYLIGSGAVPILQLGSGPVYAVLHIAAVAAGVLIWLDR